MEITANLLPRDYYAQRKFSISKDPRPSHGLKTDLR